MNKQERVQKQKREIERQLEQYGYKKKKLPKVSNIPEFYGKAAQEYYDKRGVNEICDTTSEFGQKKDVITNIYKENAYVQRQIREKASRVSIPYNKGGYQLMTPGMDPKTFGRK